jgi:hypothetical protein
MKRLLVTIALTFVLSASALAGDIPCDAPQPPPPQGMTQATDATSPGDIPCDFAEQITEAGLSGLLAVLGLLVV